MTKEEKAQIILEGMDKHMQIDWNLRKLYIKAIVAGLEALEKRRKKNVNRTCIRTIGFRPSSD